MHLKDHYRALEIEPSATLSEIKAAYRRLAHLYHPDKSSDEPYASARFAAIKEAYEVLTNPGKKAIYLQQKWFEQSLGKKKKQEIVTPLWLLNEVIELDRHVSQLDSHRMDKEGLFEYFNALFTDDVIEKINRYKEPIINIEIINLSLRSSRVLNHRQLVPVTEKLIKLAPDKTIIDKIETQLIRHRQMSIWENLQPWVILLVAVLICFLIFFAGG